MRIKKILRRHSIFKRYCNWSKCQTSNGQSDFQISKYRYVHLQLSRIQIFKFCSGACINSCADNPNDGEHSIERAFRKKYKTVAVCGATEWDSFHALAVKNWSFDKKIRITKCGITDVRVADYEKAKAFLKQNWPCLSIESRCVQQACLP